METKLISMNGVKKLVGNMMGTNFGGTYIIIVTEIPSIDLNSLKGILDELVYNGTQIANSVATKNAFTELTRVLCDVSIEVINPLLGLFFCDL